LSKNYNEILPWAYQQVRAHLYLSIIIFLPSCRLAKCTSGLRLLAKSFTVECTRFCLGLTSPDLLRNEPEAGAETYRWRLRAEGKCNFLSPFFICALSAFSTFQFARRAACTAQLCFWPGPQLLPPGPVSI